MKKRLFSLGGSLILSTLFLTSLQAMTVNPPPLPVLPPTTVSPTFTWSQDSRADWLQGTPINLDLESLSGTLQLARSKFSSPEPLYPHQEPIAIAAPPAVAVDGSGRACAVWQDNPTGLHAVYSACRPNGGSWEPPQPIAPGSPAEQKAPDLAMNETGVACVVWEDYREGAPAIYATCRTAGGNWETARRIDKNGKAPQLAPAVAVNSQGEACAAWQDFRRNSTGIYLACKPADGEWGDSIRINDGRNPDAKSPPDLALEDNGTAHIAWLDQHDGNAGLYAADHPRNSPWAVNQWVSPIGFQSSEPPAVAVDPLGNLYLLWTGNEARRLQFSYRLAGGNWQEGPSLTAGTTFPAYQNRPELGVDAAGTLYAVWMIVELRPYVIGGYHEIYAAQRPAGGNWNVQAPSPGSPEDYILQNFPAQGNNHAGHVQIAWIRTHGKQRTLKSAAHPPAADWIDTGILDTLSGGGYIRQRDFYATANLSGEAAAIWVDSVPHEEVIAAARRQTDDSWATPQILAPANPITCYNHPQAALDSADNLYTIWEERVMPFHTTQCILPHLRFSYCPSGSSCTPPQRFIPTESGGLQFAPTLAANAGGIACAAWNHQQGGIYHLQTSCRLNDGSWTSETTVITGNTPFIRPGIALDPAGTACLTWENQGTVQASCRPVSTTLWETPVQLAAFPTGQAYSPTIAADNEQFCAAWIELNAGAYAVYHACRPPAGPWSAAMKITPDAATAPKFSPAFFLDNLGNGLASWLDNGNGQRDLYFSRCDMTNHIWSPPARVNDDLNTLDPGIPFIIPNPRPQVEIAWQENPLTPTAWAARELPAPAYLPWGQYTSPVFDASTVVDWKRLTRAEETPPGTILTLETRTVISGGAASPWFQNPILIANPDSQYFQYRITFSGTPSATPTLDRITLTYRHPDPPSPPRFITPCGLTNQITPTLTGRAYPGSAVILHGDVFSATTVTDPTGRFTFTLPLPPTTIPFTATARNAGGISPASPPLTLTVRPEYPYDPLNVRGGAWTADGWLLTSPRDSRGCADPGAGWRVWLDPTRPFHLTVPVSFTTTAAVTVTLGQQTRTLAPLPDKTFFANFYPPLQSGPFLITVTADDRTITSTGSTVTINPGLVYSAGQPLTVPLSDVLVTLYYSDSYRNQWLPWEGEDFQQPNPQITRSDGRYSFAPPPGIYRLVAQKAGQGIYFSPHLTVTDAPINLTLPLTPQWNLYLPIMAKE